MAIEILSLGELCEFLIEAKRETFAKGGSRMPSKSPLSKNYLFEKGDFRYEDQYFGELLDVGEEIVWFKGAPVWGMGYRGGMLKDHRHEAGKTFSFLCRALMSPEQGFPIRGPREMVQGDMRYINKPIGDLTSFTGSEIIEKGTVEIYSRNYVGGVIYGKNNPNMKVVD